MDSVIDGLVHSRVEDERPWRWLPAVLAPGFRGARGSGPGWRLRPASRRDHAIPGAGPPVGIRPWDQLLGVFLRCALVADSGSGSRGPEAVCGGRPGPAVVVCRRREAAVLRTVAGDPGRNVLLRAAALRRSRGAGGAAGRSVLVRVGRFPATFWSGISEACVCCAATRRRRPASGAIMLRSCARSTRTPPRRRRTPASALRIRGKQGHALVLLHL